VILKTCWCSGCCFYIDCFVRMIVEGCYWNCSARCVGVVEKEAVVGAVVVGVVVGGGKTSVGTFADFGCYFDVVGYSNVGCSNVGCLSVGYSNVDYSNDGCSNVECSRGSVLNCYFVLAGYLEGVGCCDLPQDAGC
jgi:hypothetical protein